MQWLHLLVLLLLAIALIEVEVIWALLFASDIRLGSHHFKNIINIPWRHKAVTEARIERYLLRLDLDVGAIVETESPERNGPPFRLLYKFIPYYVLFRGPSLCVLLNVIAAEFEIAC